MPRTSVPIPGEILRTTIIFGLTFNELLLLASIPLVLVLPSVFIDFIPLWVSLATVAVGTVGVMIVVAVTPEGQSPVGWFPAYINRKINPDRYALKPKDESQYGSGDVAYRDTVHTANLIDAESRIPADEFDFDKFVTSIKDAEKIQDDYTSEVPNRDRPEQ